MQHVMLVPLLNVKLSFHEFFQSWYKEDIASSFVWSSIDNSSLMECEGSYENLTTSFLFK